MFPENSLFYEKFTNWATNVIFQIIYLSVTKEIFLKEMHVINSLEHRKFTILNFLIKQPQFCRNLTHRSSITVNYSG